jgi:predicted nuclease of predicted toxin-antitoxin system
MDALRATGAEVLRLREHLPTDAPDERVLATAQQLGAILVSLNGDFANIVTYPPTRYHGIIALQVHNHPEIIPQLMTRLATYIASHPAIEEYKGKLFIVEVHRIRIRE